MTNEDVRLIKKRIELVKVMKKVKANELIEEIKRAEDLIEQYAKYYHCKESEIPNSFKFVCSLKREEKRIGIKSGYKSRYKELRELLQKEVNKHD